MKNLLINPDGSYQFTGTATRAELAALYGMSEKRFRKELKANSVFLGQERVLGPRQVKQVLDALGAPTVYGSFDS